MQPSPLARLLAASVFGGQCRSSAEGAPSPYIHQHHYCEKSRPGHSAVSMDLDDTGVLVASSKSKQEGSPRTKAACPRRIR